MKKLGFVFLSLAIVLLVLWFISSRLDRIYQRSLQEESSTVLPEPEVSLPAEEATLSAEEEEATVSAEEETTSQADDEELIRQAMAARHGKTVAETQLTVQKIAGVYANGGVRFTGEIGGGWWLAYEGDEGWLIVADGNGTVPCGEVESYNFPVDMVPECWDEDAMELVTRD
jgi:hypothetical protein